MLHPGKVDLQKEIIIFLKSSRSKIIHYFILKYQPSYISIEFYFTRDTSDWCLCEISLPPFCVKILPGQSR